MICININSIKSSSRFRLAIAIVNCQYSSSVRFPTLKVMQNILPQTLYHYVQDNSFPIKINVD